MSNHFITTVSRLLDRLNYREDQIYPCNTNDDIKAKVMMDWLELGRDFKVALEKIEKPK